MITQISVFLGFAGGICVNAVSCESKVLRAFSGNLTFKQIRSKLLQVTKLNQIPRTLFHFDTHFACYPFFLIFMCVMSGKKNNILNFLSFISLSTSRREGKYKKKVGGDKQTNSNKLLIRNGSQKV